MSKGPKLKNCAKMMKMNYKRKKNGENFAKVAEVTTRVRKMESATRRKSSASPKILEAEPSRQAQIRRKRRERRAAELNRRHTLVRQNAKAKEENGDRVLNR